VDGKYRDKFRLSIKTNMAHPCIQIGLTRMLTLSVLNPFIASQIIVQIRCVYLMLALS
jgi:hypothetical protein